MADCNETLRELNTFLDGELAPQTHSAIRAHLEGCPDCLEAFDFHAELKIVVAQKCHNDEMPPGLLAKIENCFGEVFAEAPKTEAPKTGTPKTDSNEV
jgi:mycothiol system anti-sigma-R factor